MSEHPSDSKLARSGAPRRLAVFCDFDGTFSVQDVGSTIATIHRPEERPLAQARFRAGEITAWESNLLLLEGLELPEEELEAFLRTIELDPGARELLAWCHEHEVPFEILSDGFDYNLDRLKVIHDVAFAYRANHLRYRDGAWSISPGGPNSDCGCGTGTCKRTVIERHRAEHPERVCVHIGNGQVSDLCGALAADHAFAKDTLAPALEARGAAYEPFETLFDVVAGLQKLHEELASAECTQA